MLLQSQGKLVWTLRAAEHNFVFAFMELGDKVSGVNTKSFTVYDRAQSVAPVAQEESFEVMLDAAMVL